MFTGIIEETGKIIGRKKYNRNIILSVKGGKIFEDIKIGDSISVNGVCLTTEKIIGKTFTSTLSFETLSKTNLGQYTSQIVNLERALKYGDRVGGHILSGHIDFQTKVVDLSLKNKTGIIKIFIPAKYRNYFLTKGSIGIDGISLTIAEVQEEYITIWIIPYTLKNTNIYTYKPGSLINVEIDMNVKAIVDTKIKYENRKQISKSAYIY